MKPPAQEKLQELISQCQWDLATNQLRALGPAAAADAVRKLSFGRQRGLFARLPVDFAASLVGYFPYYLAYVLLHSRRVDEMRAILDLMDASNRLDLLKRSRVLPLVAAALIGIAYAFARMSMLLVALTRPELHGIFLGAGATFLRVELTLALAALWTIPVGMVVGLNPRLSALVQPIAQIAASVPATALFPIILLLLIRIGGGLGVGSIVLLLLGTQWYVLFNVIAGAIAIPTDLKEVTDIFRFRRWERWRELLLPAIFPYLITGLVTASGGAWNASIVAEYFHCQGKTFSTVGLGAVISAATDAGNFRVLLAATHFKLET